MSNNNIKVLIYKKKTIKKIKYTPIYAQKKIKSKSYNMNTHSYGYSDNNGNVYYFACDNIDNNTKIKYSKIENIDNDIKYIFNIKVPIENIDNDIKSILDIPISNKYTEYKMDCLYNLMSNHINTLHDLYDKKLHISNNIITDFLDLKNEINKF